MITDHTYVDKGNCEEELPKKPVDRQITGRLPTRYRQLTDRLPTANRQATNSFQNRKFVVKTCTKHDPETIIIPILTDQWYKMHSGYIIREFG